MKTKNLHLWVGNFKTLASFEDYLDQSEYLKAWDVYNHEPPTGNAEEDAEPDPSLRCTFCKETSLDTYDEDLIILKHYTATVDAARIAEDTLTNKVAIEKLLKKYKLSAINAVIVYADDELSVEDAAKCSSMQYLGTVKQGGVNTKSGDSPVHYVWMGEKETMNRELAAKADDKKTVLNLIFIESGIDKSDVIKFHYHHSNAKQKLDEMIILQIEDFSAAEKMILKADKMKLPVSANLILDLVVKGNVKVDGEKTGAAFGLKYIGEFESE